MYPQNIEDSTTVIYLPNETENYFKRLLIFFSFLFLPTSASAFDVSVIGYSGISIGRPHNSNSAPGISDGFLLSASDVYFEQRHDYVVPPFAIRAERQLSGISPNVSIGGFSELLYSEYTVSTSGTTTVVYNQIPIRFVEPIKLRGQATIGSAGLYARWRVSNVLLVGASLGMTYQNVRLNTKFGEWDMKDESSRFFPSTVIAFEYSPSELLGLPRAISLGTNFSYSSVSNGVEVFLRYSFLR